MSVELVTGYYGVGEDGEPNRHVSSAEDGARQAGTLGLGCYALSTGSKLSATMEDANTLVVADGDVMMNGRHVSLPDPTSFTIPTGVQGQKVSNLAVLRYQKAADSVESVTPVVLTGEPSAGKPTDPTYNEGSILDGDSPVDFPLYRVVTDGITPGDPVPLFDILVPMSELKGDLDELRDSVSQGADVLQSQQWSDISVTARAVGGVVCVTARRDGSSSPALVRRDSPSPIGVVRKGHRPARIVGQLVGMQGSTWLVLEVTTNGTVWLRTIYAEADTKWSSFTGSLCYTS